MSDDITPDLPDSSWFDRVARRLSPLCDATPETQHVALRSSIGFRELHRAAGLDPLDAGALAAAWARPVGAPRALLGLTASGPHEIDLTRDGPHALVGGTTGSGKSELLQALVAGLAANHRPDDLGFVLVDYKGGAAFRECARLPHTLGLVTDLDEHLTARALASLTAELRRRERLLADAGAKDLDAYRAQCAAGRFDGPRLARLVIVVDEFKLLADELPDFVSGLVRIAATGRSLGVHLVLATQRPSGIITGDMRANVSLRICLRVRDRADSDDVIDDASAASLNEAAPGRAFLRAGDGQLVPLQTAHVGGPAEPAESRAERRRHRVDGRGITPLPDARRRPQCPGSTRRDRLRHRAQRVRGGGAQRRHVTGDRDTSFSVAPAPAGLDQCRHPHEAHLTRHRARVFPSVWWTARADNDRTSPAGSRPSRATSASSVDPALGERHWRAPW